MPKELIVSVNGREKKIAIVENGRVTEFYIERGESEQGIVGNIYKGRVMRVLPGMQSAFVDIGLERDAFLYVSDFFDEEEEFERIVVDKKKSEGADEESAARAAAERVERSRIERERQMETAQEQAEPDADAEDEGEEEPSEAAIAMTARPEEDAAPSAVRVEDGDTAATATASASGDEDSSGRRGRDRGRRRRKDRDAPEAGAVAAGGESRAVAAQAGGGVEASRFGGEDIATPFVAGADSFERIVDEDDAAAEDGSMFKDARLQERMLDQTRAAEFDMDRTDSAEVGSLLGAVSAPAGFERVEDDGDGDSGSQRKTRAVRKEVAASVAHLAEDLTGEDAFGAAAQSFERVSDDDRAVEAVAESPSTTTAEKNRRGGGKRGGEAAGRASAKGGGSRKGSGTATTGKASKAGATASAPAEAAGGEAATAKRPSRTRAAATESKKTASKSPSKAPAKGRSRKGKTEEGEDAEASVTTRPTRGEFARRGGRRRRGGAKAGKPDGENGDAPTNGQDGEAEVLIEETEVVASAADAAAPEVESNVEEAPAASVPEQPERAEREQPARAEREQPARAEREQPRGDRGRGSRPEGRGREGGPRGRDDNREGGPRGRAEGRERDGGRNGGREGSREGGREGSNREGGREGGSREGGREGGREAGREGGGRGREEGGRGRRDRQPTITDLLREGQEIIVQIAKEPIAQKGARITSHIALPGRFLVYMPTIEHVGVSRKIESDSERVRLRKLIQAIVKEEDVPSGGFIVRTAGVGISEQELREDARYLVRTWKDIRRGSEKQKAPALAHKDLDLVQRLLRDQLSEDFTAIRVDSEEEYLAVVEFVNRIQPRLVHRVKLHTRPEPILEAYGVQPEIDKAIKPRVWLKSGGYLVINQTEALVAIDVNTGKFVGRGGTRLEDTITRTNMEAVDEIARQIRLRDLGGIIVLDLIDMEERRNRARVLQALQDALRYDKSPTKVLSFNDFGLVIMTRKRVKQSLERTLCSPCPYCTGAGLVKSPQTVCYEILEEARSLARAQGGEHFKQTTLRVNPEVSKALRSTERDVLAEIEDYLGAIDVTSDEHVHQEQFDFAFI